MKIKHTEKYLQAKWVVENPKGYDPRDVKEAVAYCSAYLDGFNHGLNESEKMFMQTICNTSE